MTKSLCRAYHQQFAYDPDIFEEESQLKPYVYSQDHADAHWQRQYDRNRVHLAIMLEDTVIGEIVLKNIDPQTEACTLGIHLTNDSVKNRGYGTRAEILALEYAFCELGMKTVYADALLKNKRSQRVLEKAGFLETHRDASFRYYKCDKSTWSIPEPE